MIIKVVTFYDFICIISVQCYNGDDAITCAAADVICIYCCQESVLIFHQIVFNALN